MGIGCVYPNRGAMATPANLVRFAHTAEALGFDTIWTSDHMVVPTEVQSFYPYHPGIGKIKPLFTQSHPPAAAHPPSRPRATDRGLPQLTSAQWQPPCAAIAGRQT